MAFILFLLFIVGICSLILMTNKTPKAQEIKNVLKEIFDELKNLFNSFKKLFKLITDIVQSISGSKDDSSSDSKDELVQKLTDTEVTVQPTPHSESVDEPKQEIELNSEPDQVCPTTDHVTKKETTVSLNEDHAEIEFNTGEQDESIKPNEESEAKVSSDNSVN